MKQWLEPHAKEVAERFRNLASVKELALLLNQIQDWEYGSHPEWHFEHQPISAKALAFHSRVSDTKYRSFSIPKKSGGVRQIEAPNRYLKRVQQLLYYVFSCLYHPSAAVTGFTDQRTIRHNAARHVGKHYVLNLDIQDFFPSISFFRVRALLSKVSHFSTDPQLAQLIARLCCNQGSLPQGAPSSPILSNMVCMRLDRKFYFLSQKLGFSYSRYADDITISSDAPIFTPELYKTLYVLLKEEGFEINLNKVRLQRNGVVEGNQLIRQRQEVTGVVVNYQPTVPREYIRNLRALLHNWQTKGYKTAVQRFEWYYQREKGFERNRGAIPNMERYVAGKIDYLGMVRGKSDTTYLSLKLRFDSLCLDTLTEERSDEATKPNATWEINEIIKKPRTVRIQPLLLKTLAIWEKQGYKKAMNYFYNPNHLDGALKSRR